MHNLVEHALDLCLIHHKNQLYNEHPYAAHPIALALGLMPVEWQIVALLHDIVEDTEVTLAYIRTVFGDETANAIDAITRRENEEYMDYIKRCKKNVYAKYVKLKDLHYHIAHMDEAPANKQHLKERYWEAIRELNSEDDYDTEN